jgi:acetyl-CoA acetyltransferase
MREVAIVGAGMTRFAKHLDRSMKDLTREAVEAALNSCGVEKQKLDAARVEAKNVFVDKLSCVTWALAVFRLSIPRMPAPAQQPLST